MSWEHSLAIPPFKVIKECPKLLVSISLKVIAPRYIHIMARLTPQLNLPWMRLSSIEDIGTWHWSNNWSNTIRMVISSNARVRVSVRHRLQQNQAKT